jgi:hypothetical protein
MSDILHEFNNARADLRATSAHLSELANAFDLTGNIAIASELRSLANTVTQAESTCSLSMSNMVNEQFQAAREASNNILLTALAVGSYEDTEPV